VQCGAIGFTPLDFIIPLILYNQVGHSCRRRCRRTHAACLPACCSCRCCVLRAAAARRLSWRQLSPCLPLLQVHKTRIGKALLSMHWTLIILYSGKCTYGANQSRWRVLLAG